MIFTLVYQEIWVEVFSEINIRPRSWKKITLALQECRIWVFYVINIRLWLERFSILCVNKLGLESSNRELCPNDSNYAICRPLGDWYQTQSVKSSILLKQRPHVLQLFLLHFCVGWLWAKFLLLKRNRLLKNFHNKR